MCHSSINLPSALNSARGLCALRRTVTHRAGGSSKGVTMKSVEPDKLKSCSRCKKHKIESEFYHRKKSQSGKRIHPCKDCAKLIVAEYHKKNPQKSASWSRIGYLRHRLARLEYSRKRYSIHYKSNPEPYARANKKWALNNRSRINLSNKAGRKVRKAIRIGELRRPANCEECGLVAPKIEAAHLDYSEPLKVRWLCISCHRTWDCNEPKTKIFAFRKSHRRMRAEKSGK